MFTEVFIKLLRPISKHILKPSFKNLFVANCKRLTPTVLLSAGIIVDNNRDESQLNSHKTDKIMKVDENNKITDEVFVVNYTSLLNEFCSSNEKSINTLITTLGEAIENTCEKYRRSIDQQIDIIHAGRGLNPLDAYWDGLITFKQRADLIKADFEKYSNLIKFVEQLAFNLSFCSAVLNDADPVEKPCDEFCKLKAKLQEELKKNVEKEQLLKKVSNEVLFE